MNLNESLNWRYAVKKYTPAQLPEEKVNEVLEAIRLSASSAGLQPYKVILVGNSEVRQKLQAASFNPQVAEASHLLVFAVYDLITQQHIDEYMALVAQTRGIPLESLDAFKARLQTMTSMPSEAVVAWAARQAYIGLGTGLIAAAHAGIDSTPMEGFNGDQFDEILGLKEKGLKSVVLLALGYRDVENDALALAKKVRVPMEQFVIKA